MTRLLDAVDELTRPRTIVTMIKDDTTGGILDIHSEEHPPLLTLLIDGTGLSRGSRSAELRIPIDADALELWAQVRDLIRLWCKQTRASYDDDNLLASIQNWHDHHEDLVNRGTVSAETDLDITRMVEGWVRMIETKFDPPEKREWTDPCPAFVALPVVEGQETEFRRCGARRIVVGGEERFAIQLNVTTRTAECGRCHCKWVGDRGLMDLRFQTNIANEEREKSDTPPTAEEFAAIG